MSSLPNKETVTAEQLIKQLQALPDQINRASVLALNRTATFIKKTGAAEISAAQRFKIKIIRDRIRIVRASKKNLFALLYCDFRGIRADKLGTPRQTQPGAVAGGQLFSGAFVARLRNDKTPGIYRRVTKKRFPIKAERIEIFEKAENIMQGICNKEAQKVFNERFAHEITRITGGLL